MNRTKLTGKTICFTGRLANMTREEAEARAAGAGAIVWKHVGLGLQILVYGENEKATSKLAKAQAMPIRIIPESEFMRLVAPAKKTESRLIADLGHIGFNIDRISRRPNKTTLTISRKENP